MSKVAVVTGSSSGIGWETCRLLSKRGWRVYGISRRGAAPEGVTPVCCDITHPDEVKDAVSQILQSEGQLDLLVNNAGFGISGPVETTPQPEMKALIETDFFGQVNCIQAVLPHMRSRHEGHIVCIGSVAAPIAIPYQAFYSAGKAAVTALALALRNEEPDLGICVIQPGDTRTGFTSARHKGDDPRGASAVAAMEKDEQTGMSPEAVARVIVKAAEIRKPRPLYTVGAKYKLFLGLFKLLPAALSYRIVGKMYS